MSERTSKIVEVRMKGSKTLSAKYRGVNILLLLKRIGKICKYVDTRLDEESNDQAAAKLVGVPKETIAIWRNKLGFKPVRTHLSGKKMQKVVEEARRLKAEGWTLAKIGKKLGFSGAWIHRILAGNKR